MQKKKQKGAAKDQNGGKDAEKSIINDPKRYLDAKDRSFNDEIHKKVEISNPHISSPFSPSPQITNSEKVKRI